MSKIVEHSSVALKEEIQAKEQELARFDDQPPLKRADSLYYTLYSIGYLSSVLSIRFILTTIACLVPFENG